MSELLWLRQRLLQPLRCPLPGDSWVLGRAEAELELGPRGRPLAWRVRVYPARLELLAKLPKLVARGAFSADPFAIARLASEAELVLSFEANAQLLALFPPRVPDLEALQAALEATPELLDLARHRLVEVAAVGAEAPASPA